MRPLYVYVIFNKDGGVPWCAGVRAGETIITYDLWRKGTRRLMADVRKDIESISKLIIEANDKGYAIVTSDFKNIIRAFNLPLDHRRYNVYDLHLDDFKPTESATEDSKAIRMVLERMSKRPLHEYQKLISNAAVVYQDLQMSGLLLNYELVKPEWSMKTFSGRCKSLGFNIQGHHEHDNIRPKHGLDKDILIHFDWISADIRIAAILSGDKRLHDSFALSDPYVYMMDILNADSEGNLTREEAKLTLLKAINSMDCDNDVLTKIYPDLGKWIAKCRSATQTDKGYLDTVLKRRFRVARSKNSLAVLNGVMQGSVAHGMHNVVRSVWEKLGSKLITDIHDSLVVSSSTDPAELKSVIDIVTPIMMYPFAGLLPDNPCFPIKISIGKRWKKWKLVRICRENGIENVTKDRAAEEASDSEAQTDSAETPQGEEISEASDEGNSDV